MAGEKFVVTINGNKMHLRDGDSVEINKYECGMCGSHAETLVYRDGKTVAHFGDYITCICDGEEEFGDVVEGKK